MDLNKTFPRSPREKLHGLVHFLRVIDKARAFKSDTLGEYIFPCPLDKIILEFVKIDADEMVRLATTKSEDELSHWVENACGSINPAEIERINNELLSRHPDSEERWKRFFELRDKIDPSRTDVKTWVDLIDLEEGRLKPA